ncbi:SLBB domain-containing protein [bacterium]|nr:SLBB domain-containing protein [bacterium]
MLKGFKNKNVACLVLFLFIWQIFVPGLVVAQQQASTEQLFTLQGLPLPTSVQSPEETSLKPTSTSPKSIKESPEIPADKEILKEKEKVVTKKEAITIEEEKKTQRFGFSYFAPAKKRIKQIEALITEGKTLPLLPPKSALTGMVGPMEMISGEVIATPPAQYILSEGDKLNLYFWGDFLELRNILLLIEADGMVNIPSAGRIMAKGLNLEQFENAVRSELLRKTTTKNLSLIVTFDRLKSIQVYITGYAFRPGAYALSSLTTLFNALNASGGPNDSGSLRDIKLLRDNQVTQVDFYNFLIQGDGKQDLPLKGGDIIYVKPYERLVTIGGEVKRPGIYELKEKEGIAELLKFCGGLTPKGLPERVHLETVDPNKKQILRDIDLNQEKEVSLHDGDLIMVLSIPELRKNLVRLEGKVLFPGEYELKKGMRVKDLFSLPNKILGEADLEMAYIVRWNTDMRTTRLISINLEKALTEETKNNLLLEELDRVIVYSKWETRWIPARIVRILGAVSRPGSVERADNMYLSDLIIRGGGLLPDAYEKGYIAHAYGEGKTEIEDIDLKKLSAGVEQENKLLRDGDLVFIPRKSEFISIPQFVSLEGEVKYPGVYALKNKEEKLSALIERAGGFTKDAFISGTIFKRNLAFTEEQKKDLQVVNELMDVLNDLEYKRSLARAQWLEKIQATELISSTKGVSAGTSIVSGGASEVASLEASKQAGQLAGETIGQITEAISPTLPLSVVSSPRQFKQLFPGERIVIDLKSILEWKGSKKDIILKDGDAIIIPSRPYLVSVIGAVVKASNLIYKENMNLDYYLRQTGGVTEDADLKKIIITRANGSILSTNYKKNSLIEEGDVIYLPTKVMVTEIVDRLDKVISAVKFVTVTVATMVVTTFLIRELKK